MNRITDSLRTAGAKRVVAGTAAAVAAAVAIGMGWALAGSADRTDSADRTGSAATGLGSVATPTTSPAGGPASPTTPPSGQSGAETSAPAPGSGPGGPGDPRIEYFRVRQEPLCPRGTTQHPIEGQPPVLEWQVTGADQVTLSVDGGGIYGTYPAQGTETFSFACGGADGDIENHTYLLTVVSGGTPVTETLVVTAEVHEVVNVPDAPAG